MMDPHAPAQFSGRVKTTHGDVMPRSAWVPSAISGVCVSAASAPDTRTVLPSGLHSPSSRLTKLTAGPMAVKSRRSADDRKDRQYAVAHEFQHLAAERVNRAGDTIEPGVERRNDHGGGIAVR